MEDFRTDIKPVLKTISVTKSFPCVICLAFDNQCIMTTSEKSVLRIFNGPTTLKDVKLHFHQIKSKTTTLLIQCN